MTDTDTDTGAGGLAGVLGDVARALEAEDGPEDTLRAVVRSAVDTVPGAARGDELRRSAPRVVSRAPSDEVVCELDGL